MGEIFLQYIPTLKVRHLIIDRMDYMMAACSTTARRGGLDWAPIFERANRPVFERLYARVKDGSEARRVLDFERETITTRDPFKKEMEELSSQEMWKTGMQRLSGKLPICLTVSV